MSRCYVFSVFSACLSARAPGRSSEEFEFGATVPLAQPVTSVCYIGLLYLSVIFVCYFHLLFRSVMTVTAWKRICITSVSSYRLSRALLSFPGSLRALRFETVRYTNSSGRIKNSVARVDFSLIQTDNWSRRKENFKQKRNAAPDFEWKTSRFLSPTEPAKREKNFKPNRKVRFIETIKRMIAQWRWSFVSSAV